MALDEPNTEETVYDKNGITMIADTLVQHEMMGSGGTTVDFQTHPIFGAGFSIQFNKRGGSCGTDCSC